jgi:flagellar hook-length control protein FliK
MKSTDLPASPASPPQAPGEGAPPSPIAVTAAPAATGAGSGDLSQGEQGFPAAAGGHALIGVREARDRSLAAKPVVAQVAVHVGKAIKAGLTRIDIELEPASLGKVEVRLDFGRDGRISALFVAETRDALDALRADARTLERALSEAGVKADAASLDFSLREQGAGAGHAFSDRSAYAGSRSSLAAAGDSEAEPSPATIAPVPPSGERRLDIRA